MNKHDFNSMLPGGALESRDKFDIPAPAKPTKTTLSKAFEDEEVQEAFKRAMKWKGYSIRLCSAIDDFCQLLFEKYGISFEEYT